MNVSPKLVSFLSDFNNVLDNMKKAGVVPTPETTRAGLDSLARFMSDPPELPYVKDEFISTDAFNIPVRIYSPSPHEELPVFVFYHGGGHMCGSVDLYDPITRKIAHFGNVIVVSVDYRLSPEFPYPAGLNDAYEATKRIWEVLDGVKYQKRLFIGGDSGGGAVSASIVNRNCVTRELSIDKQVLIYPSLDYTMSGKSYEENGTGYFLEKSKIEWYFDHYFQNNEDRAQVSPLLGQFNKDMPETLIITGGFDPIRDEGLAYGEKLRKMGVYAENQNFEEMIHAFLFLENMIEAEIQQAYDKIVDFLNR